MARKYINYRPIFGGVIILLLMSFNCSKNRVWFSTKDYHINLYVDFQSKTFGFYQKSPFVTGDKISKGTFNKTGDSLFLLSELDLFNLSINVSEISSLKPNTIVFKEDSSWQELLVNNPQLYFSEKRNLYLIINEKDTLRLRNDTILYGSKIENIQLISLVLYDYMDIVRDYPYMFQDTSTVTKEEVERIFGKITPSIVFRSNKFDNYNDYSSLILEFKYNYDYYHYQTLNERVYFIGNEIIFDSDLFDTPKILYETSYDSIVKHTNIENFFNTN
jgi:hypothetical protein